MRSEAPMSLIGTLADVKLADVLRLFASGKKSGVLTIGDGGQQAVVRFQKGMIVHAMAGRLWGEEALIDLFGWRNGQLTFVPEERSVTPNIVKDVDALILEGLRVGEVLHRRRELIPSDRVVFQLGAGQGDETARLTVGPKEWTVIRLLDGILDVAELIEASELPKEDVYRVLCDLADAGYVERVETRKAFRVQAQGLLGKAVAELDERVDAEWRKISRFASGVLRVEIRTAAGKTAPFGVTFRAGLLRDVALPRNLITDLGLHEGEEVQIRPIA